MKTFTLPPYKIDPNIVDGIIDKKVHIVCTAVKKNGFCTQYLSKRGMSSYDIANLCDMVNREQKKGVGTLFPKYSLTLMPIVEQPEEIKISFQDYFKDVIIAHLKYYTDFDTLLFIFDNAAGYPENQIKNLLEETLNKFLTTHFKEIEDDTKISSKQIETRINSTDLFFTLYL